MASKQQGTQQPTVRPIIAKVEPSAAITGGEFYIRGEHLATAGLPIVRLGNQNAHLIVAGDSYIVARVPESAIVGEVQVASGGVLAPLMKPTSAYKSPKAFTPSSNPAVDREGNVYTTFSGPRGPKSARFHLQNR